VQRTSWYHGVTRYQWLVLFVAWLGWVFDAMDAMIYAMVLHPALRELIPKSGLAATGDAIGWYGGIIFSVFLIGWAVGGVLFGVLADRVGRTRVLVFTILIYAVFTGMAALSQTWWQLGIYRFLTALGIGGEWAAGAALVAEVWPEDKRAKAAGLLQSAWAAGFFAAALINLLLSGRGPFFGRYATVQKDNGDAQLLRQIVFEHTAHFGKLAKNETAVADGQTFLQHLGEPGQFAAASHLDSRVKNLPIANLMQKLGRMVAHLLQLHQHTENNPLALNPLQRFYRFDGTLHHRFIKRSLFFAQVAIDLHLVFFGQILNNRRVGF